MGAKERGGKVYARPLGWEPGETLAGFVHESVQYGETVYTDDHKAYKGLKRFYAHETVKHSTSEYVRGQVHTNGIESFWATLKRGITGVYHHGADRGRVARQGMTLHNAHKGFSLLLGGFHIVAAEALRLQVGDPLVQLIPVAVGRKWIKPGFYFGLHDSGVFRFGGFAY